jgi:hypothetical protein
LKLNESIPEKLNLEWFKKNAQIKLVGTGFRWVVHAWRNIIFLNISKEWIPEEMDEYVNRLSSLPAILSKAWNKIFLMFDLSRMEFKIEDAFQYLRANWLKILDSEEIEVCIIEESNMRRILLQSLYKIVGKLDKIKVFRDCDEAFGWVREEIISSETITH